MTSIINRSTFVEGAGTLAVCRAVAALRRDMGRVLKKAVRQAL